MTLPCVTGSTGESAQSYTCLESASPKHTPYTQSSHREFTSIYASAWLTLLISFSLCSHSSSSLGLAVKCLKPGHWCSSYLPSVTTTAYELICSQNASVSILVQDSTTCLLHDPSVHERKPSLPKKSTVRHTYIWGFCKAKPDFNEAVTRATACLVTRPQKSWLLFKTGFILFH